MNDLPAPPAHVEPYVRVLGIESAVEFLMTFGGAELYLAAKPKGRGRLAALVGIDKAAALARAAEHLPRRVPTAKPWIARVMHAKGLPKAEIARRLHQSDVSVRRWIDASPDQPTADPRQLPLF
jgi:hypothetical protein